MKLFQSTTVFSLPLWHHMFIRFTTQFSNDYGEYQTGIFQAAAFLRVHDETYAYDKHLLTELRDWFNKNLERPGRFHKSKRKNAAHISLSWFKSTAIAHLQRMHELIAILERYDIVVEMISRDNPGYVIYEDEFQISALPLTADKNLVV